MQSDLKTEKERERERISLTDCLTMTDQGKASKKLVQKQVYHFFPKSFQK